MITVRRSEVHETAPETNDQETLERFSDGITNLKNKSNLNYEMSTIANSLCNLLA